MSRPGRSHQRFTLLIEDTPGQEVPVIHRLRSWLKIGLRSYGLRALVAIESGAAESALIPIDLAEIAALAVNTSERLAELADLLGSESLPDGILTWASEVLIEVQDLLDAIEDVGPPTKENRP